MDGNRHIDEPDLQLLADVTGEILDAPLHSEEWEKEQEAARQRAAEWLAKQPPEVQEKERQFQQKQQRTRDARRKRIRDALGLPEDGEGDVRAQATG